MKQIMVVDDNLMNLRQISALLEGEYSVMLAKSGAQALSICRREIPDLILMDIEMPAMDGFAAIEQLRQSDALSQVPVIFLTANHDVAAEVRGLESGAIDFITKPVEKSILLHRIRIHLELQDYQTDLEETLDKLEKSIVVSFADLVECKNDNTGGHVLRTSKYVEMIGRELLKKGLFPGEVSEESLKLMVQATPFHDIGKIGVSDVILLKRGPLNEDEYAIAKKHAEIGARILSKIYERTPSQAYLKYAIMMAEGHHERWDGSGYPNGLKGEEIPLCCRIMAVANVYDACLTDRVYRKALSREEAMKVILDGSGISFDPRVAEIMDSSRERLNELDVEVRQMLKSWKGTPGI